MACLMGVALLNCVLMTNGLIYLYLVCGVLLTIYTAGSLTLILLFLLNGRKIPSCPPQPEHYPSVTIQLPFYNERYVIERLLNAVSEIDYPYDRLIIQLLDDSDDDTTAIAACQVTALRKRGLTIQHIRRRQRTGYKAGALAFGMSQSVTDYYAIFDADFVPPPDFLKRTIPFLAADSRLGVVEGRWGHLNPHENALTAAQTLAIDAHFVIEQAARSQTRLLSTFNGSGGVWRRTTIEDAGGWQPTTLTEDFDLSYRAQVRGWRVLVLPDLVIPAELPAQVRIFRQQQARWATGSTQVLRQMIGRVWRVPELSLPQRIMGTLHLCQYLPYPALIGLTLLTPLLIALGAMDSIPLAFLNFSGIVPPLMYLISQLAIYRDGLRRFLAFPALIIFGTGVTLSNTWAVVTTLFSNPTTFQRTPKAGNTSTQRTQYITHDNALAYAELLVALYTAWGVWIALHQFPPAAPYLALSTAAYGGMSLWSFREQFRFRRPQNPIHAA